MHPHRNTSIHKTNTNRKERIDSRISKAEEWISELEEKMVEISSEEQNKVKRMKNWGQSQRLLGPYQTHQHLLLSVFLLLIVLVGVRCHVIVVLTCISLMANNLEHLSMYLCAIHVSSLEKCPFRSSLPQFCNWIVSFLLLSCESLYIL